MLQLAFALRFQIICYMSLNEMNIFITLAFPTDQRLALNILYLCLMTNSEKSFCNNFLE